MTDPHADAIKLEMVWLEKLISARLSHFFKGEAVFSQPAPPPLIAGAALSDLIESAKLETDARLVLALALAPHVNAAILDPFFVKNSAIDRVFSEFGAARVDGASFMPSAETALFLLAGSDTGARIRAMRVFDPDHPLRRQVGVIPGGKTASTNSSASGDAAFGGALIIPAHRVAALCTGQAPKPDFSPTFPAKRLATTLVWDDLVLPDDLRHQLENIAAWMDNRETFLDEWGLESRLNRGFKALFYGPPGTGKTLTAAMLGKRTGLDVYRVDLAQVVSKYIGETEKNLGHMFDMAEERDWILFFDEADALFGTRTQVSSSNDRYANQEVSYLLQRIEDCPGLVILATNLRNNIDDAFYRRFQKAVHFPRPDESLRRALWHNILASVPLEDDVDIDVLAREHKLAGGAINNVVRHAAISALRRGDPAINANDLVHAISGEFRKEGRTA